MLVQGWQVGGILTVQSGPPFNPTIGFDQAGLLTTQRPNLIPGNGPGNIILGLGNINQYATPIGFSLPAPGTVGDLGRDAFYAPGIVDTDFSILKDTAITKISEQFRVQFRAEFFNIFNHPNFGPPSATVFTQGVDGGATYNSTFGKITTTLTNPRQIQFGLKIVF